MSDLKNYIKKLRDTADRLEELLFSSSPESNPKIAKKILNRKSPYSKKNPHWTQRPENKHKLRKMVMAGNKARNSK